MYLAMLPLLAATGSAFVATAQSDAVGRRAAGQDQAPIEEIQVTATRRPQRTGEVSAAITLVSADEIQGAKLVTDTLAAKPGVFLQQTTPGQGAPILRGLKGSEVLHLVDGMRLNNAIFRSAPTQYLALVSPATVERIEVLRGSPASLYGSDAVGGVVHVVNRIPNIDADEFDARGALSVSADTAERQRDLSASAEFGTRNVAVLVAGNYLDTGDRRIGGGARISPSGYSARSFRTAVAFSPSDDSRWLIDWQYGEQPETPRVDELVPGFGETEPASAEFFFAPNTRNFVHLEHQRQDGWLGVDWDLDLAWQRIEDDRRSRNTGSDARRLENNSSDLFGLSIAASGEHRGGSWIVGAEAYDDEIASRRRELDINTGDVTDVQSRFPDGSTMTQFAVFANADQRLGNRNTMSGGLRASRIDVDLAATDLSPAASVELSDVSADLGWVFDVSDELSLVANLGYGFRAPNVFDLGTLGERPGNRFNVPNPSLESERIKQADVGLRYTGDRLRIDVVAWLLDYDDRITSVLTGAQTVDGRDIVQTQNRANAELWGVELGATYRLNDSLAARLVLNHTRGKQEGADGAQEPADRVPPLNGRLGLTWQATDSWQLEPYVSFAATQDRLSSRDIRDSRIDPDGTDGWVTANLKAEWLPNERWSLRLSATNLADARYRTHGSGIDAPGVNFWANVRYLW